EAVRERIRRNYGREAHVIYPPVDTDFFTLSPLTSPGDYYLAVSPMEPYKRIDLAVDAFADGARRLLVVGKGTLGEQIRKRARPPVEFVGEVSDERLRDLYRGCRGLVFPGREDFGIIPVEAQACGRPVICLAQGGTGETVVDRRTGVHFHEQTKEALMDAVRRLETMSWDSAAIRAHSLQFSRHKFRERFRAFWSAYILSDASFDERPQRDDCKADA